MSRTHLAVATIAVLIALAFVRQHGAIAHAASVIPPSTQRCVPVEAQAAPVHRAGLVVTFGDRHSRLFCVEFTEDSISGLELLRRSGLAVVTSAMGGLGGAVCRVEDPLAGTGDGSSDSSNCLLPCSGGTCLYWAYYHYTDGAWRFSPLGGSSWQIHDGDIDGWAWGSGGISSGAAPAPPGDTCPVPTQTPSATPTPQPISTPEPAPSTAPPPSATPASDDTAVPTSTKTRAAGTPTIVVEPAAGDPGTTPDESAPPVTPLSEVEAGAVTPDGAAPTKIASATGDGVTPATTPPTSTPSATPTPTPRSGVAIVGADAGKQNAARAERATTSRSGGGAAAVWAFGAVAAALAALGGFAVYRRRRTGQLL